MRQRRFWLAEAALLLLGSLCGGWFLWNWVGTEFDQSWSSYAFSSKLKGTEPTLRGYLDHLRNGDVPAPPGSPQKPPAVEPVPPVIGEVVGRIEIPRLKLSAVVKHGVDDRTLSRAVGHVPQTPLPGQVGNVGLAGHRDTHFRNLRGVKMGDVIRVVTTSGAFEYKVDSLKIVNPENVEVLDPTAVPALTLVTCYPFNYVGSAPQRFIVRARQVAPSGPVESAQAKRLTSD